MPGLIEGLFPEAANILGKSVKAFARGVETIPSGYVDLAGLPQTLSGTTDPKDVVGSTAWLDERGMLTPKQQGDSTLGQLGYDTLETAGNMLGGGFLGSKIAREANQLAPKGAQRLIPATAGQIKNDPKLMNEAAKLANDPKFAKQVRDWSVNQNDQAKDVVDGFRRAIGSSSMDDAQFGKKIQGNFGKWFDGVKQAHISKFKGLYDDALGVPAADTPLPASQAALARMQKFKDELLQTGSPEKYQGLIDDLETQITKVSQEPMNLKALHQHRQEANQAFNIDAVKPGPYDNVGKSVADKAKAVLKGALDDRLDEAMTAGSPEQMIAAAKLKRANHVFGVTTENLERLQNETMARLLGRKEGQELRAEDIVASMKKMKPSERQFFTQVANKVDPEMINQMRRHIVDDLYTAGQAKGFSSGQSGYDLRSFVTKYDEMQKTNPELIDWAIGSDPAVKGRFDTILNEARQGINNGPNLSSSGNAADAANLVAGGIGAAVGHPGAARMANASFGMVENLKDKVFGTKEKMFKEIFTDPNPGLPTVVPPGVANRANTGIKASGMGQAAGIVNEIQQAPQGPLEAQEAIDPNDLNWGTTPAPLGAQMTHDGLPARDNGDGSYSTEVSITVTDPRLNGGKPTNIPSLWGGQEVDEDTAVQNALKSGKPYSSFKSIPEAIEAAKARSNAGGTGSQDIDPNDLKW